MNPRVGANDEDLVYFGCPHVERDIRVSDMIFRGHMWKVFDCGESIPILERDGPYMGHVW